MFIISNNSLFSPLYISLKNTGETSIELIDSHASVGEDLTDIIYATEWDWHGEFHGPFNEIIELDVNKKELDLEILPGQIYEYNAADIIVEIGGFFILMS